jgi:hypothetical protein
MGFNLLNGIVNGAESFFASGGNPIAAGAGALSGGLSSGANAGTSVGNLGNSAIGALDAADEADTVAMYAENLRHQSAMQWEATWFNEMMDEKSERMREMNELRDLSMEQRKADNQITKKFIQSITE